MDCLFCKIINGEVPSYTCYEDEFVKCIMDANPYMPGHTLIIPKKHYTTFLDMDNDIIIKVHDIAKILMKKMMEKYPNINSVKVVINYGEEQKVKHYHMHLIPLYDYEKLPDITQEEFCNMLKD